MFMALLLSLVDWPLFRFSHLTPTVVVVNINSGQDQNVVGPCGQDHYSCEGTSSPAQRDGA